MTNGRRRPRPRELGDAPETRLENIPPGPEADGEEGRRLVQPPGPLKPGDQDAVGEGAVEELVIDPGAGAVEDRERDTQRDNIRPVPRDPPKDPRRRIEDARPD